MVQGTSPGWSRRGLLAAAALAGSAALTGCKTIEPQPSPTLISALPPEPEPHPTVQGSSEGAVRVVLPAPKDLDPSSQRELTVEALTSGPNPAISYRFSDDEGHYSGDWTGLDLPGKNHVVCTAAVGALELAIGLVGHPNAVVFTDDFSTTGPSAPLEGTGHTVFYLGGLVQAEIDQLRLYWFDEQQVLYRANQPRPLPRVTLATGDTPVHVAVDVDGTGRVAVWTPGLAPVWSDGPVAGEEDMVRVPPKDDQQFWRVTLLPPGAHDLKPTPDAGVVSKPATAAVQTAPLTLQGKRHVVVLLVTGGDEGGLMWTDAAGRRHVIR